MSKNEELLNYEYNKVPLDDISNNKAKQEIPLKYGFGVRHVQLIMLFFSVTVNFISRSHMGVTVVAMTSSTKVNRSILGTNVTVHAEIENYNNVLNINNTTIEDFDEIAANNETLKDIELVDPADYSHTTYDWPKSTQEMILGSFFLGYCLMTIPIGLITQRWGGKIPMQIALFVNGVMSILTPWLTNWGGWKAVCACRVMQGLSQAGLYPGIQNLLAKWIPASERGSLTSYVYAGTTIGTVLGFQISGFLGDSRWGWPSTFYAVGIISLVLFVLLSMFSASSPSEHKTISEEEKKFIMGRLDDGIVKRLRTPWKAILLSRPVWGPLAAHVGSGVSFVFIFTQVPSYIHYILGIDVKSSGLLSSLPYLTSIITGISFGLGSDYLTNNKIVSVRCARRIANSIAQFGVALSLICVSFTTSTLVCVICFVVAVGCHMAIHISWVVNHVDLAPNFSATLMMIGNMMMNSLSVLLPILVSYVVTDVTNQIQWRIMFFVIAALCITTNVIFVTLVSAETQPWNDLDQNVSCSEDPKAQELQEKKQNQ